MGFILYSILWILKVFWVVLSENIKKKQKKGAKIKTFWDAPENFTLCTPFSACPTSMFLFLFLRRLEVVFWCLEWECCTFQTLMKIHSNPLILYYSFKGIVAQCFHFKNLAAWPYMLSEFVIYGVKMKPWRNLHFKSIVKKSVLQRSSQDTLLLRTPSSNKTKITLGDRSICLVQTPNCGMNYH